MMRFIIDFLAAETRTSLAHRERGATLVEYALIIALIGVAVFVAGTVISGNLTGFLDYVAGLLPQS